MTYNGLHPSRSPVNRPQPDPRRQILHRFVDADHAARQQIARVIRHLEALDRTYAWALTAHSSLYQYCMEERGWSRGQTGIRVQVAHAGRRVPRIFDMLEAGQLSVSSASMLAPRLEGLEQATTDALLDAASGLSKRAVEELLATRFSKPDVPDRIRRVPRPWTPAPTCEPLALLPTTTETADPMATSTGRGLALAAASPPARVERLMARELLCDAFMDGKLAGSADGDREQRRRRRQARAEHWQVVIPPRAAARRAPEAHGRGQRRPRPCSLPGPSNRAEPRGPIALSWARRCRVAGAPLT